jgi:CPA2 family monovalent cation:H+ antiporter-2
MDLWTALLDILILLLAAMVLGALCERLKQSAILGYLLAGTLLGPNALNWMPNHQAVSMIAELGVALLLFTIGLEFSWRRLRSIGPIALGGGTLQVLLTGALAAGCCLILGLGGRPAVVVGSVIALSSTACVLRLLVSRAEIDSVHGRNALGILLKQDIAVVPLVLIVTVLGGKGSGVQALWETLRAVGVAALLVGLLYVLMNFIVPRLLRSKDASRNHELPILLAIVTAVGSAWMSHKLGLSPVLGAFVAGILLATSPFAVQIRADVAPLRTLFLTLFFSSIGMLSNPAWIWEHWTLVAAAVAAIVLGKAIVASAVVRLFRYSLAHAVATGICLAQVGEFSIVLATVARHGQLISADLFELIIAATIATLFLTPYLVAVAPHIATAIGKLSAHGLLELSTPDDTKIKTDRKLSNHIIIVGFGPAGQQVAQTLMKEQAALVVVELNPKTAAHALALGLRTYIGNATRTEVMEHLQLVAAGAVTITVPDPATVRQIIACIRSLSPETPIIARSRYHIYRSDSIRAGATTVVDEEVEIGLRIASEAKKILQPPDS